MTESQITIAANSIAGLAEVTDMSIESILEVLAGNIIAEEDCGRIKNLIANV